MTDKNRNFSLEEEYFIRSAIFSILSLADMFIFLIIIITQVCMVYTGWCDFLIGSAVTQDILLLFGVFLLQRSLFDIALNIVFHTKKDECITKKED